MKIGPHGTEVIGETMEIRMMPLIGIISLPMLILSLLVLRRRHVVPQIGQDALRCSPDAAPALSC